MEKITWKVIAIFCIVIIMIETSIITWAIWVIEREERNQLECLHEVCSNYPMAEYEIGVCGCYDYDVFGEPVLIKTELM